MSVTTFVMPARWADLRGTASARARLILWILLGIGIAAFFVLLFTDRKALWYDYLADFLFFTGLAQNGVVWVSVTRACNARWARPLHRMAEALAGILPISVLLFIPLMIAHSIIWPWWAHPPARKLPWLGHAFLLVRDLGIFCIMAALSVYFLWVSTRPDREHDDDALTAAGSPGARAAQKRLGRLWVVVLFAYAYFWSILGYDLNVSLNVNWYNYIYGWFFFIANWYGGLALVTLLAVLWRRRLDARSVISRDILHDNGEATFAFAIFWTYLFWAQYMVLWYANRQDDIRILLRLARDNPWVTLSWITLTLCFFLPFGFGLSRTFKRRAATLATMACFSLVGLWFMENLVVDASLWGAGFPPLISSALLSCGFLGGYGLIYLWIMRRVPFFPVRDPVMHEALVWHPARH